MIKNGQQKGKDLQGIPANTGLGTELLYRPVLFSQEFFCPFCILFKGEISFLTLQNMQQYASGGSAVRLGLSISEEHLALRQKSREASCQGSSLHKL